METSSGHPLPQRGGAQKSCARDAEQEGTVSAPVMGKEGKLWCDPLASENILPTRLRRRETRELNVIPKVSVAGNSQRYLLRGWIYDGKYRLYSDRGLVCGIQGIKQTK